MVLGKGAWRKQSHFPYLKQNKLEKNLQFLFNKNEKILMSLATRDQFHFEQWKLKTLKIFWGKGKLAFCLIGKCSSGGYVFVGMCCLYMSMDLSKEFIYGLEKMVKS